ncbi:Ribosomal protein S12 methylthiotransferase RimO [compost metagenome]
MEDDIPQEVKEARVEEIMELQSQISWDKNQKRIGEVYKCIFDRKEGNYFVGRTEYDSPDVDNTVLVSAEDTYISIGDFANVKITSAEEFDLYGELV